MLNSPTIMTWANNMTVFAHGLIVTPLIVILLTKDQISVWFLLQTMVGLGLLADAGFGFTLSRAVTFFCAGVEKLPSTREEYNEKLENLGEMNKEKLASLLSTAYRVYLIINIIFILVFTPLGIAVMWNVMSLAGHDISLWIAYGLTIMGTFVSLQTIKWSSYMTGTRRVAELTRFRTVMGLVKIIGFTLVLFLKTGVLGLSAYVFLDTVFSNIYLRNKVKNWFKAHNILVKNILFFDKEIFRSLWTATWRIGLTTWGHYFTTYGTSLIVAQVNNTALIANFLFTQKILTFIQRIAEAPFSANVPIIYTYMARKNVSEAKSEISKQLFLTILLMLSGFLFIWFFGNAILDLLNIDIRFVSGLIYFIFMLSVFLDSHATMQGTVYISTNHVPFLIPSLVSGALMVIFGFLVLPYYGLLGLVTVKLLVGLGINNWYSTYLSLRLLNWNFLDYLGDILFSGFEYWRNKLRWRIIPLQRNK